MLSTEKSRLKVALLRSLRSFGNGLEFSIKMSLALFRAPACWQAGMEILAKAV